MNSTNYFKKLFIVTVILALLALLANQTELFVSFQLFTWLSLTFFFLVSCGVYLMASKGVSANSSYRFVSMVMGSFTGKLMLCTVFLLLYVVIAKPQGKPFFIIPFFILYIVYTVMEMIELLKLNAKKAQGKQNTDTL